MEFELSTDITGQPIAKCELDCEIFGQWLTHDLGNQPRKVAALLKIIDQLNQKQLLTYTHTGSEYLLEFEDDEVVISLLHSNSSQEQTESELYDQTTACGLADFQKLLKAWQSFL